MPDPSGEPPPPSDQPPGSAPPQHLAPAPRLHPPNTRQTRDTPSPPTLSLPPALTEALEWIQSQKNAGALSGTAPDEQDRGTLPKELRKFHKFDPEHPQPLLPVHGGTKSAGIYERGLDEEDQLRGITAEQMAHLRRFREDAPERAPWLAVGAAAAVFLLAAGAFLAGHTTLPRWFAAPPAPTPATPKLSGDGTPGGSVPLAVLEVIDAAMSAEASGNYAKAIELLQQAQHNNAAHLPGVDYRLALLHHQAGDPSRVEPLLDLSIAEGEEVAACCNLRGTIANQRDGADEGLEDLERATRLDPFNARYLFDWGEALRRAGKPQVALVQLRHALDRLQEPALLGLYALKVRLCEVETAQEDRFGEEMAAQLRLTPPPVEWLLTAAAVEMHRSNFPAAAEDLNKVRALIGERETAARLQDVFFKNFSREEELVRFFVPTPP